MHRRVHRPLRRHDSRSSVHARCHQHQATPALELALASRHKQGTQWLPLWPSTVPQMMPRLQRLATALLVQRSVPVPVLQLELGLELGLGLGLGLELGLARASMPTRVRRRSSVMAVWCLLEASCEN